MDPFSQISAMGRTVYSAPECLEQVNQCIIDSGGIQECDLIRDLAQKPTLGWRIGIAHTEESVKNVKNRASAFAKLVLAGMDDCIVIGSASFLPFLIRAFERNGCCVKRSRSGALCPGERIRVTEKKDHCGGCQHNCLLSNPGCGVGRDKASRGY